jgi:hypothetical protein
MIRQRVDGDRQSEIRIKLVGDAQGISLKSETQQSAVALEGGAGVAPV